MSSRPVLAGLLLSFSAGCATQSAATKEADIRKLLAVTGAEKMGAQAMAQMTVSLRKAMPQVPERFWVDFQAEVKTGELVELVVPIYDKHLTDKDVKTLLRFYETPTGKRYVAEMPAITQESMVAGQEWGKSIGQRVMVKLQAELAAQKDVAKP